MVRGAGKEEKHAIMTRMPADPPIEETNKPAVANTTAVTSNTVIANTTSSTSRDYAGSVISPAEEPTIQDAAVAKALVKLRAEQAKHNFEIQNEHWLKAYWRPMMGWLYMFICFMDFIGFPVMSWMAPVVYKAFGITYAYTAWQPITLLGGGMVHMSFGAVLGITAWARGVEKTKGQ